MNYKQQLWEHYHYRFGLAGEGQADIIERYVGSPRGRILNVGCGPWGDKLRNLAAHADLLLAVDNAPEAVATARVGSGNCPNVYFVVTDAGRLCLPDAAVDHILALGLFAHVPENRAREVLSEFHRVCRGRGHLFLTNSVRHPKEHYVEAGKKVGFRMVEEHEGYCPAASGGAQRRYLLLFAKD